MGWERYLFLDMFTASELNALDEKLTAQHVAERDKQRSAKARIEALEADLERVALLARALADLCLSKGLLTKDELLRQLLEADLPPMLSGNSTWVMPGEFKPADPDPGDDPAVKKSRMKRSRPYP